MARIYKGILGGFRGTVGTVVGSSWRGIDYMRSRSGKRKGTATAAQLEQRARFSVIVPFISSLSSLFETTFKSLANGKSGSNAALSYNISNALTGSYPAFAIDYSQVQIATGKLTNAGDAAVSVKPGSVVQFDWTDNAGTGSAKADDKMIGVLYCPALKQSKYITDAAMRSTATASMDATEFSGKTVETWISFISADGKNIATSIYCGQVLVS